MSTCVKDRGRSHISRNYDPLVPRILKGTVATIGSGFHILSSMLLCPCSAAQIGWSVNGMRFGRDNEWGSWISLTWAAADSEGRFAARDAEEDCVTSRQVCQTANEPLALPGRTGFPVHPLVSQLYILRPHTLAQREGSVRSISMDNLIVTPKEGSTWLLGFRIFRMRPNVRASGTVCHPSRSGEGPDPMFELDRIIDWLSNGTVDRRRSERQHRTE